MTAAPLKQNPAHQLTMALGGTWSGDHGTARCPSHADEHPSLAVALGENGRPLVRCRAGCSQEDVLRDLDARGIWPKSERTKRIVATYQYCDARGKLQYEIVRYEPKSFLQRYPDGRGGYVWKKHPQQVLYQLPQVLKAQKIYVVEGEKDCDTLAARGHCATTAAGGASAPWLPAFTAALRAKDVVVVADNDTPGWRRALDIARALIGRANSVQVCAAADGAKDVTAWYEQQPTKTKLRLGSKTDIKTMADVETLEQRLREQGKLGPVAVETDEPKNDGPSPYTDSGNAERLARKFAGSIRYCAPQKTWYVWRDRRWEPDQAGEMMARTKQIARDLYLEAASIEDAEERKRCAEWARRSESSEKRKAALFLAQSEPGIAVLPGDFDRDPFLLNCLNGTVDLKTGKLREHHAEDLITRLAPVEYDPSARSELWERFLRESTGENQELEDFTQRAAGYSLTGSVREEVLFFVHGPEAAGKSTFLESLKASYGDYSKVADFESFIARRDAGQIRNDIAELAGRRLVLSIEVEQGKKLAEGLVKMLTGGDTVRARFLYQEGFEFLPQFKLWLAANHAPKVRDSDGAMWRRILRIPFENIVPKENRDPALKATLRDARISGPSILAWAVRGCIEWQKSGLRVPEVVERATEEYRESMDPLKEFFDQCCEFVDRKWTAAATLRAAYETWAKANGEHPIDGRQFAERLRDRGCIAKRTHSGHGWRGIMLIQQERDV